MTAQATATRDVLLMDGSTVRLRQITPADEGRLRDFFARLSPRSRYLRFHSHVGTLSDEEIRRFVSIDDAHLFGIVATLGERENERIIGVGHYFRQGEKTAEVAFAVEDTHQGRGIATQIMDVLAEEARDRGIETFEAYVLGENRSMMEVFRASGYPLRSALKYGTLHVSFPIEQTELADERAAEREAVAASASLLPFFRPGSVAVIGASRERGTFGAEIFHNIVACGFTGAVYPVNPRASEVERHTAYPSVLDIPGDVDLAIIVVPAGYVLDVVDQCAQKGVRGIVVISAGFRETDAEGRERERQLLEKARHHGIRLIGPNCLGLLNADPAISLNATFAPIFPRFGNVGLLSQSGALGIALLDHSRSLRIGLSTFVSVGNKADVSGNDVIQYWEQDPATDVILLYLESFGNPRKFARLAPRIAAKKPIVAVKSGRSAAGSRAASSHTGALASVDVAVDALFKQSGVIRVDTLEDMFDVANLLAHQPLPAGRRVAILTNAGGPGILAADACEAAGLQVVSLSERTTASLRRILPREASVLNPVDMIASAASQQYAETLRVLLADECVDAVIVIFIPPLVTRAPDVARAVREVIGEANEKTVLACFMTARGAPEELSHGGRSVPSYIFPESAAHALARVAEHAEWRKRPRGHVPSFDVDAGGARAIVEAALGGDHRENVWLSPSDCTRVLEAYGIRTAPVRFATTAKEASAIAEEVGFPVAVKLASQTITHKTDVGGVVLGVRTAREVTRAYNAIRKRLKEAGRAGEMDGVTVQPMVEGGVETIVGLTYDSLFGPLIVFGLGGTLVELMKDVQLRIQPLTDADARDMVRSVKGYPLLEGWRGSPPADVAALEEILLRVSCLAEDLPEIAEMDLNPVRAREPGRGAIVLDARMMLRRP
jgi:acetyl coenzyme A synthetase (ADP forming)-like protein